MYNLFKLIENLILNIARFFIKVFNLNITIKYSSTKSLSKNYVSKSLMTSNEKIFYNKLLSLENELDIIVHPQINLATIINKPNSKYRSELFRNIDFALFSKDYSELYLLIELNDSTHKNKDRYLRDKKVKAICEDANIQLITFYSSYPNELEYIKTRIIKLIEKKDMVN